MPCFSLSVHVLSQKSPWILAMMVSSVLCLLVFSTRTAIKLQSRTWIWNKYFAVLDTATVRYHCQLWTGLQRWGSRRRGKTYKSFLCGKDFTWKEELNQKSPMVILSLRDWMSYYLLFQLKCFFFAGYFIYLHLKCYLPSWFSLCKPRIPAPLPLLIWGSSPINPPTLASVP